MNKKSKKPSSSYNVLPPISHELAFMFDQSLEMIYIYFELPLQNACYYFGNLSLYKPRQRTCFQYIKNLTGILVQGYLITFILYFLILFFAPLFSLALQRYYFLDPLLSINRQCINIQFVRINHPKDLITNHSRLKENFLRENFIIRNESYRKDLYNYTQFYQLLDLLESNHYIICQRSLYLYARFQTYSSLLHSNYSQFRFYLPKYPKSFFIDQPPFIDLCVQALNRSHSEKLQSQLLSLSSYSYSSINLFIFNFNFTQVTITLYELNQQSTHLERISIHSGWLRDIYSQFEFFKYEDALSTVLFDGFSLGQQSIDYFNYIHIPVPADSLLGLNEMVQQTLLVLPLCQAVSMQQ